jgi:hypothetical protein
MVRPSFIARSRPQPFRRLQSRLGHRRRRRPLTRRLGRHIRRRGHVVGDNPHPAVCLLGEHEHPEVEALWLAAPVARVANPPQDIVLVVEIDLAAAWRRRRPLTQRPGRHFCSRDHLVGDHPHPPVCLLGEHEHPEVEALWLSATGGHVAKPPQNIVLVVECPSSDDLRHIAGFRKGGSGSSVIEIMRHAVDAASDGLRLSGA